MKNIIFILSLHSIYPESGKSMSNTDPILSILSNQKINSHLMDQVWEKLKSLADENSRVNSELQNKLKEIESKYWDQMDDSGKDRFQTMVAWFGAKMIHKIRVPEGQTSYWLRDPSPLANFQ